MDFLRRNTNLLKNSAAAQAMKAPRTMVAEGAEDVKGKDIWLVNDDVKPLKLRDRTWTGLTYFTFWFSAAATVSNWSGISLR